MRQRAKIIGIARHRLSTDGDGVTTLVAFHGCPLRCRYCLNPQSLGDGGRFRDLIVSDEHGNLMERDKLDISRIWIDEDGEEDSELSPEYFDEKHPCRIYWDYDVSLQDEDDKPLKEATLRIEADGYDDPITIKVKYPKRNAKKTIKFKHKKK